MSDASLAPSFVPLSFGSGSLENSFVADSRFVSAPRFVCKTIGAGLSPSPAGPVAPDCTEEERLAAFDQGLRQGRAEGLAEAKQENAERRKLGVALRRLDEEMTERLARQLSETVAALCEATLAPLALDQARLAERCRDAAVLLGEDLSGCTLRLHPADVARLDTGGAEGWHIAADDTLEPGSVCMAGSEGEIASGPQEWRRSLAEILGIGPAVP